MGFGGDDEIGRARAGARRDRAVAGEAFDGAPFERQSGFAEALLEGGFQFGGALAVDLAGGDHEFGVGKSQCGGHWRGNASAWMPIRWLPSRVASGTTVSAVR